MSIIAPIRQLKSNICMPLHLRPSQKLGECRFVGGVHRTQQHQGFLLLSLVAATTCHIFKQVNASYSMDTFLHGGEWSGSELRQQGKQGGIRC